MITDITLGQYYPTGSVIHKADPRFKLLSLIAYIVFIFLSNSLMSLLFATVFTVLVAFITKVPVKVYLKNIKTILPIIILTSVLNMFYVEGEDKFIDWWIIDISWLGVKKAIFMSVRIILLIIVSAMLTYTTTPTALTDAIESLLSPLKYIGLGSAVHTIAMMMTIALRFIPTLIDETNKLMNAQKARGADFESGNLLNKAKALIPILIPLLISSVRRAIELSEAMESRCYNSGDNRTRLKQLKYTRIDIYSALILVSAFALIIVFNYVNLF